jgi:hypothetical protein
MSATSPRKGPNFPMKPNNRVRYVVAGEDDYQVVLRFGVRFASGFEPKYTKKWLCLWWYPRRSNNKKRRFDRVSIRYQG